MQETQSPLNHQHRRARRPEQLSTSQQRLERSREDRVIAGVFGGISKFVGVNARWLRILYVIGVLLSLGVFIVGYMLLWLFLPSEP